MSLVQIVTSLTGRQLTTEEITKLSNLQHENHIDDSDPLLIVLALMARSQLIVETLPLQLQQCASATIELHQQTLREQSTLISKELILTIAQNIEAANINWKLRWMRYGSFFAAGSIATGLILSIIRH